jgi:signal transduction histidine kinase
MDHSKGQAPATVPPQPDSQSDQSDRDLLDQLKPFLAYCLKVNHEINNPLAGIIGYTEYMLDDDDPLTDDQRHYVKQIMQCAERIQKIVSEMSTRKADLLTSVDLSDIAGERSEPDSI